MLQWQAHGGKFQSIGELFYFSNRLIDIEDGFDDHDVDGDQCNNSGWLMSK